jgi:hypothetical protein
VPLVKSRKRRSIIILSGFIVFLFLIFSAILSLRRSGLEEEIAKLRTAGPPVAVEDLNAWYPPVAAESNAALGVIAAAELRITDRSDSLQLPKRGEVILPRVLEEIREYATTNSGALQALHAAVQSPESRYPVALGANTFATGLPNANLGQIKGLAQLLHYQTVRLVSEGKAETAFAPVRDGFALAATLRNEPFLISELVRIACAAIAVRNLECALPAQKFSEEQLREISERLERCEADCSRSWQRAIVGERTMGIQHFKTVMQTGTNSVSQWDQVGRTIYVGLGFHDRDFRLYLEMMSKFSLAMTNTFPAAYERSLALQRELNERFSSGLGRFAMLSRSVLPAVIKATGKEAALVTSLRCARTAVAVERYRLDHHGALAENLQQLVPKYLPEQPRDAARGELLVFELRPDGYEISSPAAAKALDNKASTTFPVAPWRFKKD